MYHDREDYMKWLPPASALLNLAIFSYGASASASTLVVDLGGTGNFSAIQPAIDAAQPGDTVLLKAGEYEITESIRFKGKAITVRSESGPEATTIRMSEAVVVQDASVVSFENEETPAAVRARWFSGQQSRGQAPCDGAAAECAHMFE